MAQTTSRRLSLGNWVGVLPFLIFTLLFLILPTMNIVLGAFRTPEGAATLANLKGLFTPSIMASYWISIKVSLASALFGCLIGFGIAASVTLGGLPAWLRGPLMTFSGVASNFAGVPLAFAFLATLGRLGLVTVLLKSWFGINIYAMGFNLLSFWGLTLTYLFFQVPLMILIITPALDGLKREWREAASILGATNTQYWRLVAFPILLPSILGTIALLSQMAGAKAVGAERAHQTRCFAALGARDHASRSALNAASTGSKSRFTGAWPVAC